MEPEEIQGFNDEEIKTILREALKVKIDERKQLPRRNQLNVALSNTLCEFMACYRLIGFDLDGNPLNLMIYNTKMEKSALDNLFVDEVNKFISNKH
jgi:hypothetical protein